MTLLLAANSGATDAMGFLALGGTFTSVMTGNMVIVGIAAGTADLRLVLTALGAITCFVTGCALGARWAGEPSGSEPVWPPTVLRALTAQLGLTVVLAVGWEIELAAPSVGLSSVLLFGYAAALGIQSSAVRKFGAPGLSTTYLTGTLTTLVGHLTSGRRLRDVRHSALILLSLIAGAALSTVLVTHLAVLAGLLPVLCLGTVDLVARRAVRAPTDDVSR